MVTIRFEPLTHHKKKCIALYFAYTFETKEYIKNGPGVTYTRTHRCFYIVANDLLLQQLRKYLLAGKFRILDNYTTPLVKQYGKGREALPPMNAQKSEVHQHFLQFLKGKRFSASTIATYGNVLQDFLRFTNDKPVELLNENDVRLYIEWAVKTLNYAVSTHRQMVSAIKHFAHFYPTCSIDSEAIYMPRKDKKLPTILSAEEILHLIQVTKNLKHRVIIAMLYASGLRIGELLALELKDFDFNRNVVHIRNAKGRKDRYATLAKSLYPLLNNYHHTYTPKTYFIESPKGGVYSASSVRSFLRNSCKAAGITKTVTPHSLRHSYATHLLEQGTDIRYIQELLGHSRPETTMIYTQVSTKDLRGIKSPLDITLKTVTLQDNDDKKPSISQGYPGI